MLLVPRLASSCGSYEFCTSVTRHQLYRGPIDPQVQPNIKPAAISVILVHIAKLKPAAVPRQLVCAISDSRIHYTEIMARGNRLRQMHLGILTASQDPTIIGGVMKPFCFFRGFSPESRNTLHGFCDLDKKTDSTAREGPGTVWFHPRRTEFDF